MTTGFLDALKHAADQASAAEEAFRREISERMKRLERERVFAHRRFNFMRGMAEAIAPAPSAEESVALAQALMRTKLGWSDDSPARDDVLARFSTVAQAVFANRDENAELDVIAVLSRFEDWYRDTHPGPFWALFDYEMPETPVVDF